MKLKFTNKNKKFSVDAKPCNLFQKFVGLMFSRRENAKALLLFDFKKPAKYRIHSFFVFFSFVAVWLDNKNRIINLKIVKPFRLSVYSKKPFCKLIEIPVNKKYQKIINDLGF